MKPSEYMQWSRKDRTLAEGLIVLEAMTGDHGHLIEDATDPDRDGFYDVQPTIDHAAAAKERWEAENNKDREPGTRLRVVLDPNYKPRS